jgi:hypothetical protein
VQEGVAVAIAQRREAKLFGQIKLGDLSGHNGSAASDRGIARNAHRHQHNSVTPASSRDLCEIEPCSSDGRGKAPKINMHQRSMLMHATNIDERPMFLGVLPVLHRQTMILGADG